MHEVGAGGGDVALHVSRNELHLITRFTLDPTEITLTSYKCVYFFYN